MGTRAISRLAFALSSWGLVACSFVLDPEQKQCTKDSQCTAPYVCGSAGYCEKQSGCDKDADCRQPGICEKREVSSDNTCEKPACAVTDDCGQGELCNTESMRCVDESQASCNTSDECAVYDGAQVCVKSEGVCGQFECVKKADCGSSPTVSCTKGACIDPQWGCLGDADPRPAQDMSSEGSLEVKVLYIFPTTGELETGVADLRVRVCQFLDATCASTVTEDISYEDKLLTIRGLENGKNYTIRLEATHPTNPNLPLIETEYQMYRTIVGKTVEPRPIIMFEKSFRTTTAQVANVTVDPELGMILAYALDCGDKEVPGVAISVDKTTVGCGGEPTCATTSFYFTAANLPDPDASQTGLAGRLGLVNLLPDTFNRLTLTRTADNTKLLSFVIVPRKDIITYTYFYPRSYGTEGSELK